MSLNLLTKRLLLLLSPLIYYFSPFLQHHLSPTQTQSHLSTELRTKLMKSETKRISKCKKDDSDVLTTEFPYVSADTLRRKQTNLRDALGSHMCVHPDCKISTGECLSPHTQHNESQVCF